MSLFKSIMTKNAYRTIANMIILGLIALPASVKAQLHIIPQPNSIIEKRGHLLLHNKAVIGVDADSKTTGLYLQNYLAQNYGLHLRVKIKPAIAAIHLNSDNSGEKGAYNLNISRSHITISGNAEGVFYGVQSLIQLLPGKGKAPLSISECEIADAPRFQWRGLSLDVSRITWLAAAAMVFIRKTRCAIF